MRRALGEGAQSELRAPGDLKPFQANWNTVAIKNGIKSGIQRTIHFDLIGSCSRRISVKVPRLVGSLQMADIAAKVENRITPKISRKLIFWTSLQLHSFSVQLRRSVIDFG